MFVNLSRHSRRGTAAAICFGLSLVASSTSALAQQPAPAAVPGTAVAHDPVASLPSRPGDPVAPDAGSAPAPAATAASREAETAALVDRMQSTITALERRVTELETRLAAEESAKAPAPALATPVTSTVAAAAPTFPTTTAAPAAVAAPAPAADAAQASEFPSFFRNTEVTGFVDVYYGYNHNHPPFDNQLRNFDTKPNQFAFNMFELALEKKPTEDDRVGFRTDLDFGPATEIVHAYEPGGEDVFRHVEQAYVSYLAPVGKGLQIDAGKFVTPAGAEVIETKDNWNYSRGLLFALAIPYYHFGVRATYAISDKATVAGYVVNGWNDVVDNNRRKTYGASVTLKPVSKFTLVTNYLGGPEQSEGTEWRHLIDTTATVNVTSAVSLMANYDYGRDRIEGAGTGVHWQGIAGYARFQVGPHFAFTPRFEWYDDHDGYTTGLKQQVKEFTLTGEHPFGSGFIGRLEYRRDFSDRDYFLKFGDEFVRAQSTVTVGLVYSFDSLGK